VKRQRCFAVAQQSIGGRWQHYLHAWVKDGVHVQEGAGDPRAVPIWGVERDKALKLDEPTAHQLVDQFDKRYGQTKEDRRVVKHLIEELP
jgi:hypothetical protein